MKKKALTLAVALTTSLMMSSCYTLTYTVGRGPQTGVTTTGKNHYLIAGLVPLSTTSPTTLAGGAQDYEVTIQHTFVDGLLNAITGGIYNPTTTTVKK